MVPLALRLLPAAFLDLVHHLHPQSWRQIHRRSQVAQVRVRCHRAASHRLPLQCPIRAVLCRVYRAMFLRRLRSTSRRRLRLGRASPAS